MHIQLAMNIVREKFTIGIFATQTLNKRYQQAFYGEQQMETASALRWSRPE